MRTTRLTLFYPAAYLVTGGVAMFVAPDFALKLFLSDGDYGPVFPRFAGVLTFGLGILVVQVIRHETEALYSTILWLRGVFCAAWIALWMYSRDPMFLVLLGMVGAGFLGTVAAIAYDDRLREQAERPKGSATPRPSRSARR